MEQNEKWLQWAVELQSLAQAGIFYGRDEFDRERYERIREIATEMISFKSALPGGWVDVNVSVKENVIKEVKEEAGLDVTADMVIAVQDREKHNLPVYAYKVCKIFVLCTVIGGGFKANIETVSSDYFERGRLPALATEKNNEEQIDMCFDACLSDNWKTVFD